MDGRAVRTFVAVFVALLVLLALTVVSSFVRLGAVNVFINLGIAGAKAGLIAMFFMELRSASALVRVAALAGIFWLALLLGLTLNDVLTRPA